MDHPRAGQDLQELLDESVEKLIHIYPKKNPKNFPNFSSGAATTQLIKTRTKTRAGNCSKTKINRKIKQINIEIEIKHRAVAAAATI